jgi:hypothetical protein
MAGATPIYSFPYPESSDLVAAYPALGQDLAEDIETVIAALPPGGLTHIATESFSAVSSVSLNGVFTSEYQNYHILFSRTSGSSTTMRLRASGTDDSSSNYELRGYFGGAATGNQNLTGQTSWNVAAGSGVAMANMVLSNPAVASPSFGTLSLHSVTIGTFAAITHQVSSVMDGISFLGTTITGTIRVYGYQNS